VQHILHNGKHFSRTSSVVEFNGIVGKGKLKCSFHGTVFRVRACLGSGYLANSFLCQLRHLSTDLQRTTSKPLEGDGIEAAVQRHSAPGRTKATSAARCGAFVNGTFFNHHGWQFLNHELGDTVASRH